MANEEQLEILAQGVGFWNKWRKDNPDIEIYLWGVNLCDIDLNFANLSGADLSYTHLWNAKLAGANLTGANLTGAQLINAFLNNADLSNANLYRADLSDASLKGTNLSNTNLTDAKFNAFELLNAKHIALNLEGFNFEGCNLNEKDLTNVNFTNTNLVRVQALGTSFNSATLTGACIQDWNINSETNFDNLICDYIYLKEGKQERRPADPNRNFEPGEFAKLVQKSVETIDLIFSKGVDWKAVAYSIKNTQILNEDTPLTIQSIENKGDEVVLIKVNVPQNANKGKIEGDFWQGYEFANKTLKEQYEARLLDKDEEINRLFTIVTQGKEVQKLMADANKNEYNFNAPVGSVGNQGTQNNVTGEVKGDQIGTQHNYASEEKQTLAEAAAEIQKLLEQLKQNNPDATPEQQEAYVNAAIPPTLKQRCVSALKSGDETAIEEFLDNPYLNVGKAVIKAWIKPE